MKYELFPAVFLAFLYLGTGLLVYAVTGVPRSGALTTGILLTATGFVWGIRWTWDEVRK